MFRIQKQFLYGGIFLVMVLFVTGLIVVAFLPKPSCDDGKKNQNEIGVDCGGVCSACDIEAKDITVSETTFVPSDLGGTYDVVAQIVNPNELFGSGALLYTFELLDENGEVVGAFSDTAYILPAQERYIMALAVSAERIPSDARVLIEDVRWEAFSEYEAPTLPVTNKMFEQVSSGTMYAEAKGLVRNESPYDFETVEVFVVLRDASGSAIAIGKTDMQTVRSGERRDFSVFWKSVFPGEVASVDVRAMTNMFENQNFIKLFFPDGRFRSYE